MVEVWGQFLVFLFSLVLLFLFGLVCFVCFLLESLPFLLGGGGCSLCLLECFMFFGGGGCFFLFVLNTLFSL